MKVIENGVVLEKEAPEWRRQPVKWLSRRKKAVSPKTLGERIDAYCADRYDRELPLSVSDMAGAVGFVSVAEMYHHARRGGPRVMAIIARGLAAVGAGYEDMARAGNRGALEVLRTIPMFDPAESASQEGVFPFGTPPNRQKLVMPTRTNPQEVKGQLSEQEAYLALIKHRTYEESRAEAEPLPRGTPTLKEEVVTAAPEKYVDTQGAEARLGRIQLQGLTALDVEDDEDMDMVEAGNMVEAGEQLK